MKSQKARQALEDAKEATCDQEPKRVSLKLDKMMDELHKDMKLIIQWDNDERQKRTPKEQSGYLWLTRGLLAHKLSRKRLSERALRNAVEQANSVHAWRVLLRTYQEKQSLNSVLVTLVEIIDHMEQAGLHIYERLPPWMEEPLNQIIAQYGIQTVVQTIKKQSYQDCKTLVEVVQIAHAS